MTKWRFADVKETPKIRGKRVVTGGSVLKSEMVFQKRHRVFLFRIGGIALQNTCLACRRPWAPNSAPAVKKLLVSHATPASHPLCDSPLHLCSPALACRLPYCLLHGHWALHSKRYPLSHLSSPNLDFVMKFSRRSRTFLSLVCCVREHVYMCEHMCSVA